MPTLLTYAREEANNVLAPLHDVHRAVCGYGDCGYLPIRTVADIPQVAVVTLDSQSSHRRYLGLFRYAMEMEKSNVIRALSKTERVRVFTPDEQKAVVKHFRDTGDSWMADMFMLPHR